MMLLILQKVEVEVDLVMEHVFLEMVMQVVQVAADKV
tara:strand:+ start:194 stop:304 length:111 start_codon:yes stop_codon:yes gene_type:complete